MHVRFFVYLNNLNKGENYQYIVKLSEFDKIIINYLLG